MSTKAPLSTKDKRKAPVTRQQSAGQASHLKNHKTSADMTLEEEDDEGTEEDDKPSTRTAPVSDHEAPDDQQIEALRDDPVLAKILAELR